MRRLPWSDFVRNHPRAHLVVAFLPETGEIGTPQARAKRDVLISTIRQLVPLAVYATTIVRASGQAEIHCAFADEAAAAVLAAAMKAKVVGRYTGYASQRRFRFDDAAAWALRGALPPSALGESQRQRMRESSPETATARAKRGLPQSE